MPMDPQNILEERKRIVREKREAEVATFALELSIQLLDKHFTCEELRRIDQMVRQRIHVS